MREGSKGNKLYEEGKGRERNIQGRERRAGKNMWGE